MKKLISLSALLLGVILLAGCANSPVVTNSNQPTAILNQVVAINQNVDQLITGVGELPAIDMELATFNSAGFGFSAVYPKQWYYAGSKPDASNGYLYQYDFSEKSDGPSIVTLYIGTVKDLSKYSGIALNIPGLDAQYLEEAPGSYAVFINVVDVPYTFEIASSIKDKDLVINMAAGIKKLTDPIASWKTYSNEDLGFEISYPDTWSREGDWFSHILNPEAIRPEIDQSSVRITLVSNPESLTLDEWLNKYHPLFSETQELKETKNLTIDGADAVKRVVVSTVAGGYNNDMIIKKGDRLFYFDMNSRVRGDNQKIELADMDKIIESFKFIDIKESIAEVESYTHSALCTDTPTPTDIGREVYPIAPQYAGLKFLGQLFTAYNCGQARVNKIFGVEGNNYTLGSTIWLIGNPSQGLVDTFKLVGFKCGDVSTDASCKVWQLRDTVKINDLMKLEPHHEDFKADDCINCG